MHVWVLLIGACVYITIDIVDAVLYFPVAFSAVQTLLSSMFMLFRGLTFIPLSSSMESQLCSRSSRFPGGARLALEPLRLA